MKRKYTSLLMYAVALIVIIAIALFLCFGQSEGFHRPKPPYFPKTGTCNQRCRNVCGDGCYLGCLTTVDGQNTSGCKFERKTPGTITYPCHVSRNRWGHRCMAADN